MSTPRQPRRAGRWLLVLGLVATVSLALAPAAVSADVEGAPTAASGRTVLVPPVSGMYHAAFPSLGGSEDHVSAARIRSFERCARRRVAWVYFSDNWMRGIRFPTDDVAVIRKAGKVPFIRLMPRSSFEEGGPDPLYTMQAIVDGRFDTELRTWFAAAAALDYPLICEFGTEVNGDWFPWNGRWNGGATTTGYGDPGVADGPERFRDAYRHIIEISRAAGASQITWVFHVNADAQPRKPWNTYAAYYPGDGYIDWIGVSVYGGLVPGDYYGSFRGILDGAYPVLCALSPDKPLAVLEWGMVWRCARTTQARWVGRALADLRTGCWPRIKGASCWHERWRNDDGSVSNLRVDACRATTQAYRRGVAGPAFVTRASFEARCSDFGVGGCTGWTWVETSAPAVTSG